MRRAALAAWSSAFVLASPCVSAQLATADRLQGAGFWPTKGTAPRADYVGADACAGCHASHAASQSNTPMARTLARAEQSDVLRGHERLEFGFGRFKYDVTRKGSQSLYTVSDGLRSLSAPLAWAFGFGKVGQTWFFEHGNGFREARVSHFEALRALNFTPTRSLTSARDVEEAMGRAVPASEARRCFGCHSTAATAGGLFDTALLTPGVRCEACHGPGRAHAQAGLRTAILNPRRLAPADSVDFCGACHATFWDVKLAGEKGVAALRSQPHRLQSSRCWGEGDARLTCVACHDPHRPLLREAASYDARCLACHVQRDAKPTAERPGKACPTATERCTTCHMPKYEVQEMHFRFTDHLIRTVRASPLSPARE